MKSYHSFLSEAANRFMKEEDVSSDNMWMMNIDGIIDMHNDDLDANTVYDIFVKGTKQSVDDATVWVTKKLYDINTNPDMITDLTRLFTKMYHTVNRNAYGVKENKTTKKKAANRFMNESSNEINILRDIYDFDNQHGTKIFHNILVLMMTNTEPPYKLTNDMYKELMPLYKDNEIEAISTNLNNIWYDFPEGGPVNKNSSFFGDLDEFLSTAFKEEVEEFEEDLKNTKDMDRNKGVTISTDKQNKKRAYVSKGYNLDQKDKTPYYKLPGMTDKIAQNNLRAFASAMANRAYNKGIITYDDIKGMQGWRVDNNGNISVGSISQVVKMLTNKGFDAKKIFD